MLDFLFGISTAVAETAPVTDPNATPNVASCGGQDLASILTLILPLLLMVVVFYFLLIRPQKKKEKQVKAMLDALKPGDRVTTIGGIYGTVSSIKDDMITLVVGVSKTEMVFARWAIRNVDEQGVDNDTEVLA